MIDEKDRYFEFLTIDDNKVVVKRDKIIDVEQKYSDKIDLDASLSKTTIRCMVMISITDNDIKEIPSTEKMKDLLRRLYLRAFSGT